MSISLQTSGVHHVTLRSTDLQRSRRFYVETLGFPVALEAPNLIVTLAGATAVVLRGPDAQTPTGDVFNPFRVGLDHVALACTDETELERVGSALSKAGVENTGSSSTRPSARSTSRSRILTELPGSCTWCDPRRTLTAPERPDLQ